jgi:PAS domain S-box-containing protein
MSTENKKTILLVEDEAIIAMGEKITLEKFGYKVLIANSGEDAIATIANTPAIDLILMDINLGGGIDGTEIAARILKRRDIPVVFLSSHTEPEIVKKTEKITSYGYVVKASSNTVIDASIKMAFKLFEAKIREKEKDAVLLESAYKIRALFDETSSFIGMMKLDGTLVEGNRAALQLAGISAADCIGKPFWDTPWWAHSPEMQDKLRVAVGRAAKGETVSFEATHLAADKSIHYVEFSIKPIKDNDDRVIFLMPEGHDITDRKQVEAALHESKAQLANALQMVQAGHWEYDVDSDLFTFNDNFYRIFRTTVAAVGGYQMSSADYARKFCHPDDMAMVGDETRAAIESSDPDYNRQIEHRILYADGQVGHIAVRFFISKDAHGRTIKTYGANQDITWRKLAEEDIKRQLAEKEILLKEVHHRIKNNITSIGGLISLRLQSINNPEAVAVLQDAVGRVESMRILYEKMLFNESFKDISVKNYVESLVDAVVALFPDNTRIKLEKFITDFQLDSKRLFPLGIIINELLTNTMKYAFSSGDAGLISISLTHVKNHVTIIVQDNSQGLPDGFDIDKSKGFGLTLVKMLCQQLGGSFTIESKAGTRSKVEFDV